MISQDANELKKLIFELSQNLNTSNPENPSGFIVNSLGLVDPKNQPLVIREFDLDTDYRVFLKIDIARLNQRVREFRHCEEIGNHFTNGKELSSFYIEMKRRYGTVIPYSEFFNSGMGACLENSIANSINLASRSLDSFLCFGKTNASKPDECHAWNIAIDKITGLPIILDIGLGVYAPVGQIVYDPGFVKITPDLKFKSAHSNVGDIEYTLFD